MARMASAVAAKVRLGKPNNLDATAMMIDILAKKKDSREVKRVVGCLALIHSNDRFRISTDKSISLSELMLVI